FEALHLRLGRQHFCDRFLVGSIQAEACGLEGKILKTSGRIKLQVARMDHVYGIYAHIIFHAVRIGGEQQDAGKTESDGRTGGEITPAVAAEIAEREPRKSHHALTTPSLICTMRETRFITRSSWVEKRKVMPFLALSPSISSMIFKEVSESRLAVGSSAKT